MKEHCRMALADGRLSLKLVWVRSLELGGQRRCQAKAVFVSNYIPAWGSLSLMNLCFFYPVTSSVLQKPTVKLLPKWALFSSSRYYRPHKSLLFKCSPSTALTSIFSSATVSPILFGVEIFGSTHLKVRQRWDAIISPLSMILETFRHQRHGVSVKCFSSLLRIRYDKCPHTLIHAITLHPHNRKSKRKNDAGSKKLLLANTLLLAFKYFTMQ